MHLSILCLWCSREDDVVNWNENKFDEVADKTHNNESHEAGVQDLEVLGLVGLLAFVEEVLGVTAELFKLSSDRL